MIIVWSVVIGVALLLEFLLYNLSSAWFAVGGLAALIAAACSLFWPWQILVFVLVSFLFLLALRPFLKKFLKEKTQPTNLDAHIGEKYKLLKDVEDNKSEIKIGDTFWTVKCTEVLLKGDLVEITGMEGNKYVVRGEKK